MESDVEVRIDIAANFCAGLDNLLQLHFDEVIVRVDVLFHKSLDLEEGRKEIPFVSFRVDRIGQGFGVVEGFEERFEVLPKTHIH